MSTSAAGGNGATLAGGNRNYGLPRKATGLLLPWERSVAAMKMLSRAGRYTRAGFCLL